MAVDLDELERLAQGATHDGWLPPSWLKRIVEYCDEQFIEAVSPDVVLELIAEVRRLRELTKVFSYEGVLRDYGYVLVGPDEDVHETVERITSHYPEGRKPRLIIEQVVRDEEGGGR